MYFNKVGWLEGQTDHPWSGGTPGTATPVRLELPMLLK
jgi:hypothetical protein